MLLWKTASPIIRISTCAAAVFMLSQYSVAQKGYISAGKEVTIGLNVINRGAVMNALGCQVQKGRRIIQYSPSEISEYGIGKSLVYKSFSIDSEIPGSRYFLERVSNDPFLYMLRLKGKPAEYFYVPGDSMVVGKMPPSKAGFREYLKPLLRDCEFVNNNLQYLKPRKNQLKRFVADAAECSDKPFPRVRYTLTGGYILETISQDMSAVMPGVPGKIRIQMATAGAFADLPVYPGDLSFHGGLLFRKADFTRTTFDSDSRYILDVGYSALTIPVNLRYSYLRNSLSLFLEAGPLISVATGKKALIHRTDYCEICYERTVTLETDLIETVMPGFSAGAGTILGYGSGISWFAGINYFKSLHLISMRKYFNFGDIGIFTGFVF